MARTKKVRTRAAAKKRQRSVARKRTTTSARATRPAATGRTKTTTKKRQRTAARPRTVPALPSELPAGATKAAFRRPEHPGGGPPGSGAGPRHADEDQGTEFETTSRDYYEASSDLPPLDDEVQDPLEKGPPYAGIAGGAVGGTPAQLRSSGGRTGRGLKPGGSHRGDSTIGADPDSDAG